MRRARLSGLALAVLAAVPLAAIDPPREPAPPFRAKSLDGEQFTSASLRGRVVLLQFWTTWCGYCRRDQPAVEEMIKEFGNRGLVVLAVSVGESKETVTKYLARSPRTAKIILTENTNLAAIFQTRGFPLYVLLDRNGLIAGAQPGAGGIEALRQLLGRAGLKAE